MSANETIDFLKSDHFYRFDPNRLKSISEIVRNRDAVDREFLDTEMETTRKLLLTKCEELLRLVGAYTFPFQDSIERLQTVVQGELEDYHDEPETVVRIKSRMAEMQSAADRVCSTYDELIRIGRTKGLGP